MPKRRSETRTLEKWRSNTKKRKHAQARLTGGIDYVHPSKLRFENTKNEKTLKQDYTGGIDYVHPSKLRFENT